ncbi:signal peptidase II [Silicimonas sp. MF1-12-2]|jgi:signal peptidase II|uniref:signal peptidase II n=1 Tax=Silicimonas sp. MF1-12-2 TaxID=3384793 RepID=UPI0039B4C1A3
MPTLAIMTRTAIVVFVLDQLTKLFVVQYLDLKTRQTIMVLDPFLNFRMAWNQGINFGIGAGLDMRWVLVGLALLISAWIVWWMRRDRPGLWVQMSAGLVLGGAIGNVIDRIVYGAVADFLNMACCGFENPWSFNVADISIFLGAIGLIFLTGEAPKDRDVEGGTG